MIRNLMKHFKYLSRGITSTESLQPIMEVYKMMKTVTEKNSCDKCNSNKVIRMGFKQAQAA